MPSNEIVRISEQLLRLTKRVNLISQGGGGGGMIQHANEYHTPDMALADHEHEDGEGNLDGGVPDSEYGGIETIDGGDVNGN